MPFSLQTKYYSKALKQGDVVAIREDGFKYCEGDCLKEWIAAGRSAESYTFAFVINYITDEDMDGTEPEVLELLAEHSFITNEKGVLVPDPDAEFQRKRYLTVPKDYNHHQRVNLRETGETRITWAEISQYIRVRA